MKAEGTGYAAVIAGLRQAIEAGGYAPGLRLPAERDLVEQFGCARTTVRRALQALESDGLVERRHGSGTYVADLRPISNVLHIRDIREEIAARGHRHTSRLLSRSAMRAGPDVADAMRLRTAAPVFRCEVMHFENGAPIQLEERFVNPAIVPDFLTIDLDARTVSGHLFARSPLTGAEQVIEAVNADRRQARLLGVRAGTALLKVSRRTWSRLRVASIARLYHPGRAYRLLGEFSADGP